MNKMLPNFNNLKQLKKGGVGMKLFNSTHKDTKGFTLIELLIVIVIIGILAGVLIAVINPAQQQNRARDATVEATLNKVALAVGSFKSAYGRVPNNNEFDGVIDGEVNTSCSVNSGIYTCTWQMSSIPLPGAAGVSCGSGANQQQNCCSTTAGSTHVGDGTGNDTGQCYYRYSGDGATGRFRIWAKSFGIDNGVFVYDSSDGGQIQQCDNTNWDSC